jgi:hypothetical protein
VLNIFGGPFYFSLIRKYVILMGTLLNNIRITRTDASGNLVDLIKVPITYGPKDKMLARIKQDPGLDVETAVTPLPMISFEMGKLFYDGSRKLNTMGRVAYKDSTDANKFQYQYNPVPYNIDFKVLIYAKNAEDGTKIIEQILPYFTPDWTTTVNLIPEVDVKVDIPIVLNNVSCSDNYNEAYTERRAIIWELDFTLKGWLYGPVKSSGVIKFIKTNFYLPMINGPLRDAVGNSTPDEIVTIQPGLTANGQPTTNVELTIPYSQIEADDDYGFITIIRNE